MPGLNILGVIGIMLGLGLIIRDDVNTLVSTINPSSANNYTEPIPHGARSIARTCTVTHAVLHCLMHPHAYQEKNGASGADVHTGLARASLYIRANSALPDASSKSEASVMFRPREPEEWFFAAPFGVLFDRSSGPNCRR